MGSSTHVNGKATPSQQHPRAHVSGESDTVNVQPLGQVTVQRAFYALGTQTPADVLALQRTVGNQVVQRLLADRAQPTKPLTPVGEPPSGGQIIQPKLTVGPVGDKYEEEADHVAKRVMKMPAPVQRKEAKNSAVKRGPVIRRNEEIGGNLHDTPVKQRLMRVGYAEDKDGKEIRRTPIIQRAGTGGFEVDSNFEGTLKNSKGGGTPLPDSLRADFEPKFGADFGGVKVHTDAQSDQLNRSIQAKAFTSGSDIYFRKGQYNPGTDSGQQLIAHELTHTVQQGATSVQRDTQPPITLNNSAEEDVLQRDIGFEFETQQMLTKKGNTGALPAVGFPDANTANGVFNADTSTRIPKGDSLLSKADVEVQADDSAAAGMSDLEVVTTHFPLDNAGRGRLNQAMADVLALVNAYPALANPAGEIVPAAALNGVGGFHLDMNDGMFLGRMHTAQTAGQVTFGIRAGNIGDIVSDLHGDTGETNQDKTDRDPGRLRIRPANNNNAAEPRQLAQGQESNTLVAGHTLAKNTVQQYTNLIPAAPGGPEIIGFVTIIFAYCEAMQHKQSFLKNHTPLMAKTNMATLFSTLPDNVQQYYSRKRKGKSNLERLIATAPGYDAKMNQALFHGVNAAQENIGNAPRQWYHKLKLKDWLRAIVRRDRTLFEGLKAGFQGSKKRPGKDKLTNSAFPKKPQQAQVEGYGALGQRMDTDTTTGDNLPVFELRSASKLITYAQAQQWALDLFDYIRSVNDNPGGGHTKMV